MKSKIKSYIRKKLLAYFRKKPEKYGNFYKLYNWLNKRVSDLGDWKQIVIAIALAASFLIIKDYTKLLAAPIILFVIYLLISGLKYLLWKFIQTLITNTGIESHFTLTGKHIIVRGQGLPCLLSYEEIPTHLFEFATEETVMLSAELNSIAYKDGPWGTNIPDKRRRNLSHIRRNNKAIMYIKTGDGDPVGFTHIFPINKDAWESYMAGEIEDNKFPDEHIIPSGEDNSEEIHGLIVFSIIVAYPYKNFRNPKTYRTDLGSLIEGAVSYHIKTIVENHVKLKDRKYIPVLFQNMSQAHTNFFKPCNKSPKSISGDGAFIISFNVTV